MLHELDYWKVASFYTFTYNDENLPKGGTLVVKDFQNFLKRFRKQTELEIKYYMAGEYGVLCAVCGENEKDCKCPKFIESCGRPHYHAIIYGYGCSKKEIKAITEIWGNGFVYPGTATGDSILYVAKYIMKQYNGDKAIAYYGNRLPPYQRCSQGIGAQWCDDNKGRLYRDLFITRHGKKVALPRYYKKRLSISSEQTIGLQIERLSKERLWFEKHNIGETERSEYRRQRAKQTEEELKSLDERKPSASNKAREL